MKIIKKYLLCQEDKEGYGFIIGKHDSLECAKEVLEKFEERFPGEKFFIAKKLKVEFKEED